MDALDFARLRDAQHWSWVRRDDGLERLSWSGPLEEVDRDALGRLFGLWHPMLVGLDRVDLSGGILSVHTRLFVASSRPTRIPEDAALVLSSALETVVDGRELLLVNTIAGATAALPSPYCWRRRREPSQSEFGGAHLPPSFALHARRPATLVAAFEQQLLRSEWCAQALAVVGGRGSGRTTLLDQLAFEAGFRGARVTRHPPRTVAASQRPLVVLLDDADEVDPRAIESAVAAAERVRRRIVIVASTAAPEELVEWTGLDWQNFPVPPVSASDLCASVHTIGSVPRSAVESLASESSGNPARFRFLLQAALRLGKTNVTAAMVAKNVVSSLDPESRAALVAAALAPGGIPYEVPAGRIGRVQEDLAPWLSVSGRRRLRPIVAELQAALADEACPEACPISRELANAWPPGPEHAAARSRLSLRGGDIEAAVAALREAPTRDALAIVAAARDKLGAELILPIEIHGLAQAPGRGLQLAEMLATSGRSTQDDSARAGFEVALAAHLVRLDRGDEARASLERLAGIALAPADRSRFLLANAMVALAGGSNQPAAVQLRDAARVAPKTTGPERGDALFTLGRFLLGRRADDRRGRAALAAAVRAYEECSQSVGAARARAELLAAMPRVRDGAVLEAHHSALAEATLHGDALAIAMAHAGLARELAPVGLAASAEQHLRSALHWLGPALGPKKRAELLVELASVRIELGNPARADELLDELSWADADPDLGGRLELLRSRSLAARGLVKDARAYAERAHEFARHHEDDALDAGAMLKLAEIALDLGDPESARDYAERGLRAGAAAVRAPVADLWLALARAALRVGDVGGVRRALGKLAGEQHRADHAVIEAIVEARAGARVSATTSLAEGLRRAARDQRWEVRARVVALALSEPVLEQSGEDRRSLLDTLRSLHQAADVRARLAFRGVPAALVSSASSAGLDADGLMAVAAIRREAPEKQLPAALDLLRRKISCDRAAAIADVGDGLRVLAQAPDTDQDRSLAFALELVGRSRLLRRAIHHTATIGEPRREDGAQRVAAAIPGTHGVGLYVERPWPLPSFDDREIAFAAALAETLTAEGAPRPRARPTAIAPPDLGLVGESHAMVELRREVLALAGYGIPVFLHGESGTGKELVARALHEQSPRRVRAFLPFNCAAMPETLIESELFGYVKGAFSGATSDRDGLLQRADGGTLFLDEVAELTPLFQAKLLRVVEQGEYRPVGSTQTRSADVRFVCATNRNMVSEVREGRFREDLYYRLLSTATIELPPLRERAGDIVLLLSRFVERTASEHHEEPFRLDPEALEAIESHRFPGNVRELERLVLGLHARFRGRSVAVADLPLAIRGGTCHARGTLEQARRDFDRRYLRELLQRHAGNRTRAARSAGIARQTLLAMMRRLGEMGDAKQRNGGGSTIGAKPPEAL